MSKVLAAKGEDITRRTRMALERLSPRLPQKGSKILIKPNVVDARPKDSGAITRPEVVEAVIQFLGHRDYQIYVGEGSAVFDTLRCFEKAGYLYLEQKYDIKLVDLNRGEFVTIEVNGKYWKGFSVAKIAREVVYVISAPVLKQHPFQVTLALKNMMGVLKPGARCPLKSYIHKEDDQEIWADRLVDLVFAVRPNLAVIDATTGMFGSHLTGRLKEFDLTLVSEDALACDILAARLLGYEKVFYLDLALKRGLGTEPTQVERIFV
ncbi:MAG: DUF362 domain-containing protein [Thermodesulfobacteriota bacterium]